MLGVCIGKCDIMIYCLSFVREGTVFENGKSPSVALNSLRFQSGEEGWMHHHLHYSCKQGTESKSTMEGQEKGSAL